MDRDWLASCIYPSVTLPPIGVSFVRLPAAGVGKDSGPQTTAAPAETAVQTAAHSGTVSAFEGMVREFSGAPPQAQRQQAGPPATRQIAWPPAPQRPPRESAPVRPVAVEDSDTAEPASSATSVPLPPGAKSEPPASVPNELPAPAPMPVESQPVAAVAEPKAAAPIFRFVSPAAKGATEDPEVPAAPAGKGTRKAAPSPTKPGATSARQAPFIGIPVMPPPPPLPLPVAAAAPQEREKSHPAVEPKSAEPAEHAAPTDTVLQVTLKTPNEATSAAPAINVPTPVQAKTEPPRAAPEMPVIPAPVAAAASATPQAPAVSAPVTSSAMAAEAPAPAAAAKPAAEVQEPVLPPDAPTQQIKSVSLEFTPDGAGDVRLRVTERAGEVHISLHSADASLSGKLHEGVHDLVGSLSSAGYEAEAWTPGQGQQGGQQQEQKRPQRPHPADSGGEEFGNLFDQPVQEVS